MIDSLSLIVFPLAFYSPETRLAGALAFGLMKRLPGRDRPTSFESQGMYTQRRQYSAGLKLNHYSPGLEEFYSLAVHAGEYPDAFYGVGGRDAARTPEAFSARTWAVQGQADKRVFLGWRAGVKAGWWRQTTVETDSDGLLAGGAIAGSGGWSLLQAGPILTLDTRNSAYYPTRGIFAIAGLNLSPETAGSDFGFGEFALDARTYLPMPREGAIALQALAKFQWGEIPFPFLARTGGPEILRGYYLGRYQDRDLACLQSEYRFSIWHRLGGAVFASTGSIADAPEGLAGAEWLFAYGAGLRVRLNGEGVNLRLDLARPSTGPGAVYLTFMEAF